MLINWDDVITLVDTETIFASGVPGQAATIEQVTAESLPYASAPTVENLGNAHNVKLKFGIPRGVPGNESLDDSKGDGDTDYVRSASMSYNSTGYTMVTGWTTGYYIAANVTPIDFDNRTSSSAWRYVIIDCSEGDCFLLNLIGENAPRAFAFIDENYIPLVRAEKNRTLSNYIVVAPKGTKYLLLHDKKVNGAFSKPSYFRNVGYRNLNIGELENRYKTDFNELIDISNAAITPLYKYHFDTVEVGEATKWVGDCYKSGNIFKLPDYLMIKLTPAAKALVSEGYAFRLTMLNNRNDSRTVILTPDRVINVARGTYYLNFEYGYIETYLVDGSSNKTYAKNNIIDINDYVEVYTMSPYYKDDYITYVGMPSIKRLINDGDDVVYDESGDYSSTIWSISFDVTDAKYLYSDVFAFDYALFDAEGNVLKQLSGDFTTCCIEIPKQYNGKNVAQIRVNICTMNNNSYYQLYNFLPLIRNRIRLSFSKPVVHAPVASRKGSIAISNARFLTDLFFKINFTIQESNVASDNVQASSINGALYRSIDRHQTGYGKSFTNFVSLVESNFYNAIQINNNGKNSDLGIMCSGAMFNFFQDPVFLSTSTFFYYYHDYLHEISDLSEVEVGDIIFWDGLTGTPKRSNHVALCVDKISVGGSLRYVITAESKGLGGCTLYRNPYPFSLGDRRAYVLKLSDYRGEPKDIRVEPWLPDDAEIFQTHNYARTYDVIETQYNTKNLLSFWGDRVNIPTNSLQNVYVKPNSGSPYYSTLKVYKNGSQTAETYNISSLVNNNFFALEDVIDGTGYYEFYGDDNYCFCCYVYDRTLTVFAETRTLDVSSLVSTYGCEISRFFVRKLYESGQGRATQYVFRPITAEEIENHAIVFGNDENRLIAFNDFGMLELSVSFVSSDDNYGDDDD